MHAGDIAGARAKLTDIESAAGADSGAWRRLAEFHTHLNQHEQAATCAIRVATLKPYDAQAAYAKASALIAVGRMAEAEEILDELIGRAPEDADAWYNRATLRRQAPGRQPRRVASRRARRPLAGVCAGRAAIRAREGAGGPRAIRGVLRRARQGRKRAPQGALLPRRGRRAGHRLDHQDLRPRLVRVAGAGLRRRGAPVRRRPAAQRHDARRADPDPARIRRDGRRSERPRARRHAHGRARRRQGRADQGRGAHRSRGARRVLLDRDPGLRALAPVRGRQDAAQLSSISA